MLHQPYLFQAAWSESLANISEEDFESEDEISDYVSEISEKELKDFRAEDKVAFNKVWKGQSWNSSVWAYQLAREIQELKEKKA